MPRRTVCSLDGEARVVNRPERSLQRNVPFSSLPQEVIDLAPDRWTEIASGRWKWCDHNTLGEGRAALMVAEVPSRHKDSRDKIFMSLQDNLSFAGAAAKGRSAAMALNYLLRKLASLRLAANFHLTFPWIQTKCMPADALSRLVEA